LDITRLLTDKKFRAHVITYIDDPVVKNFWVTEFASWNDKFASEAVAPVLNKVGAFTANPMIRNIIGQSKSTFNIRQIMDEGKIWIVNLSRGLMGEDNAGILGAMMVTKIQLAAMGRADLPQEQRRPFYLYVDEFQNFATDSFATILSEARKYGLNLTVANQYISQMSEPVRNAVFGNVGTIVCFRISPDDSPFLQKYFEPQFEAGDLIQQHSRFFVTTMMISDEKAPAFSAKTLNLPVPADDLTSRIVALSRERYTQEKAVVEELVRKNSGLAMDNLPESAQRPQLPTAKPKVQAQLNQLDKIAQGPSLAPARIGKFAATAAQPSQTGLGPPNDETKPKRRRGKRGGRKNRSAQPAQPQVVRPNTPSDEHEQVIHLR
jgi:hypothetical protein